MANNVTALLRTLQGRGLLVLRENAVAVKTVDRQFVGVSRKGKTIDYPISVAQTTSAVTPGPTEPANVDVTPTVKQLTVDQHYWTHFNVTDQERTQLDVDANFVPGQLSQAIKALANQIDASVTAKFKEFGYSAGTAGTTPFSTEANLATAWQKGARKTLNSNAAPMSDRVVTVDVDAEANLASLAMITDADRRGDTLGITEAFIGRKLGANWVMDQNVVTHTSSGATGYLVNQADVAVGDSSVTIDTGSGTITVGDSFTVAGDTQTYSVTSGGTTSISFAPKAKVAWANNAAITVNGTDRVVNAAYHPLAIGLATAQFENEPDGLAHISQIVDPVTNIAFRLEMVRGHYQSRYKIDALWGVDVLQPELGCEIWG